MTDLDNIVAILRETDPETSTYLAAIPDYPVGVLPDAARDLVLRGTEDGLPSALIAGAALAALAGAIGAKSSVEISHTWHERAILWLSLIAPRGAGKSPSQDLAFAPLRDYDAQVAEDDEEERRPFVRLGDQTLEALARNLHAEGGAGVVDVDELATLLRGLGEYKRGGGGDRGRFLSLWSGSPWGFDRVAGGEKTNKVRLRITRPTLTICGGLQTALHDLLGGEDDGLRPRWLPHLSALPEGTGELSGRPRSVAWQALLGGALLPARDVERNWYLSPDALKAFQHHRGVWKRQARDGEMASVAAALVKADVHLARIVLVLAEAEDAATGGPIAADLVERSAAIVDFTLNCWRALPEQGSFALTYRDSILDKGITKLIAYLENRGPGPSTKRDLQQGRVGGARTAEDLDALLRRYEASFPGSIEEMPHEHGGKPTVLVWPPKRRPVRPVPTGVDVSTPVEGVRAKPHEQAISGVGERVNTAVSTPTMATPKLGGLGVLPIIGDDGFLEHLFAAFDAGHVTERERDEAENVHRALVRREERKAA